MPTDKGEEIGAARNEEMMKVMAAATRALPCLVETGHPLEVALPEA